jgi:hypothetical protein
MIVYTGAMRPMEVPTVNNLLFFNELMIAFTTIQMLLFTAWVPDEEVKFYYGWHISFYILVMVIVNFYFILKSASFGIRLMCKKYYIRY